MQQKQSIVGFLFLMMMHILLLYHMGEEESVVLRNLRVAVHSFHVKVTDKVSGGKVKS